MPRSMNYFNVCTMIFAITHPSSLSLMYFSVLKVDKLPECVLRLNCAGRGGFRSCYSVRFAVQRLRDQAFLNEPSCVQL